MNADFHRRSPALVASILMMFTLVAAQEAPVNVEAMRPGEIIIKPTGKVRVVKVAPAAQGRPTTQPSAVLASATTRVTVHDNDGVEYTERSVRLPLGYDPAENYGGGYGPVLNLPLDTGYPEPYYGGILGGYGYGGGYGYRHSYGYSDCGPLIGFGGGRGYGSGLGYHGSGHSSGGWSGVGRSSSAVWIPSSGSGSGSGGGSSFSSSGGHSGGGRSGGGGGGHRSR